MISVCRNANGFRFVAAFCAALIGAALQIAAAPARGARATAVLGAESRILRPRMLFRRAAPA
jgi:hypothetical protein